MKFSKKITLAGVAATLVSAAAFALPAYHEEIIYFSDATHSKFVGEKTITCNGTIVVEGTVTAYSQTLIKERCDWWKGI